MKNKSIASLSLRKLLLSALVAAPLATLPVPLWALPASQTALNGIVTLSSGTATWTNANQIDITTTSTNTFAKWTDFGNGANTIGAGDVINFNLPTSSAAFLNIVGSGNTPSTINGKLWSNGNLYVLNPAGIVVGSTGVIIANSVGLSTVSETEYNFLATGKLQFVNNQPPTGVTGAISSTGVITAASGTGNVWIVGQNIDLAGTIDAGNVSVSTQGNGYIKLGSGGDLTIGDASTKSGNLTATATGTGAITVAATGNVTVIGPSLSLTTGNKTITQGTGYVLLGASGSGANASFTANSGTDNTTIGNVSVAGTGNTLTANITAGIGNITTPSDVIVTGATATDLIVAGGGNVTLNASTVKGALTVTAANSILSGGSTTVTNAATLTAGSGKDITFAGKAASVGVAASSGTLNNVSLTSTDVLALGAITAGGNLTVSAAKDITQTAGQTVTKTASITSTGGNVTLSQAVAADKLIVSASKDVTTTVTQSPTTSASFTGTAGNVTLAAVTSPSITAVAGKNVTLNGALTSTTGTSTLNAGTNLTIGATIGTKDLVATGGTITQTGAITSSGTATISGSTAVTLNGANDFTKLALAGAASDIAVTDTNGLTLANGTNATGNVTLTSGGAIAVGAASADSIKVGGILTLDTSGTAAIGITQASDNTAVTGKLVVKTQGGAVDLSGSTHNGVSLNNSYGQVNINTVNGSAAGANATIFSATGLNLGTVTLGTGGNLRAYSATSISNSAQLTIAGNVVVGAGTAAAPGDISLANSTATTTGYNQITGTIYVLDELGLINASSAITGTYLGKSLTVVNDAANAKLVELPKNAYGAATSMTVNLSTVAADLNVGNVSTTGLVTLGSNTGAIVATGAGNTFTTVTVTGNSTSATNSAISTGGNLAVTATLKDKNNITFTAGTAGPGDLSIAGFTSGQTATTTGTTAFVAGNGTISDAGTGIFIYGDVSFTGKAVSITNAGHNFGGITVNTSASNGNATIVEGGTSRYVSINTGTGMFSGTSQNGDILESTGAIAAKNVILSAVNGSVTASGAANAFTSIGLTAKGNSSIVNTAATTLGTISVTGGTLAVSTNATAITQATGSTINVYGATSVTAGGAAGDITLGNSGNQFGALTLGQAGATGKITIKESGTMNLASVTTSGAFTATSETADIVDSGALNATGASSLTAANVTFTKTGSTWGALTLTTTGNATVLGVGPAAGPLTVGGNVTGNLSITSTKAVRLNGVTVGNNLTAISAGGFDIDQTGASPVLVSGDATFSSGNAVTLSNTSNRFGTVKFTASAASIIDSANTFTLRAGSFSTDAVTINTGGGFLTTGTGGSSFTGSGLTINALAGTIKPSAGSLLVTGTFTVNSNVGIDLSALSQSGNLNNKTPVTPGLASPGGTAPYTGPGL